MIAFLLGQPFRVNVRVMAGALAYSTPSVFRALQNLLAAGIVRAAVLPTAAEYWIDAPDWYRPLGGAQAVARWGYWREVLGYVCAAIAWEARAAKNPALSDYAKGVQLREVAEARSAELLRWNQQMAVPNSAAPDDWQRFHEQLAGYIRSQG